MFVKRGVKFAVGVARFVLYGIGNVYAVRVVFFASCGGRGRVKVPRRTEEKLSARLFIKIEGTYIAKLFVEPVLQNASIGSKLLEYAIKEHNADHLWALEKNAKAIRFYERHGFTVTGEKKQEDGTAENLVDIWGMKNERNTAYTAADRVSVRSGMRCHDCRCIRG